MTPSVLNTPFGHIHILSPNRTIPPQEIKAQAADLHALIAALLMDEFKDRRAGDDDDKPLPDVYGEIRSPFTK